MRKPVTPVTPVTPHQRRRKLKRHSMEVEQRDSWRAMDNAGVMLSGLREALDGGVMRTCACGNRVWESHSSAEPDGPLVCSVCGEEKIPR